MHRLMLGLTLGACCLVGGVSPIAGQASAPYREEELRIANGAVTLAGTLTLPDGAGPFPAAVMITGSGRQNRDEEIAGFRVFKTIAEHLASKGIATYRFDDRGFGRSTGVFAAATTADFAGDALAALDELRKRPDVAQARIGMIGHSDGAASAAIAATRSPNVGFIVLLAGTGAPIPDVLRAQAVDIPRTMGVDAALLEPVAVAHKKSLDAARNGTTAELTAAVKELVGAQYDMVPPEQRAMLGDRTAFIERSYPAGLAQLNTPWMKFMLDYDPAATLGQVRVPVLALFGSLDTQVAPASNEPPLRAAIASNPSSSTKIYPGANHLFQPAKTGAPAEYAMLPKEFVPGLLDDIASWITRVVPK